MKEQDGVTGRGKTLGAGRLQLFFLAMPEGFHSSMPQLHHLEMGLMVQTSSVNQTSKQTSFVLLVTTQLHRGSFIIISIISWAPQLYKSCSNHFLPCFYSRRERLRLFKMPMIFRGYACILVCLECHVSHIKIHETKFQIIMSAVWILWGTSMECTVLHYPGLVFAFLCHIQLQRRHFLSFCSLQKL